MPYPLGYTIIIAHNRVVVKRIGIFLNDLTNKPFPTFRVPAFNRVKVLTSER
jgi:hypothetical protein